MTGFWKLVYACFVRFCGFRGDGFLQVSVAASRTPPGLVHLVHVVLRCSVSFVRHSARVLLGAAERGF